MTIALPLLMISVVTILIFDNCQKQQWNKHFELTSLQKHTVIMKWC